MVCGSLLEYIESEIVVKCTYCAKEFKGYIKCPNGHYVCDMCHNRHAIQLSEAKCASLASSDPIEIFEEIIRSPGIPMLGCHHAFMAANAFITAINNESSLKISDEMKKEVFERTQCQAIGGYCGLTGICGIAPAIGACFAVILGSKCGKNEEQKKTMEAVSEMVSAIAKLTGPSCCKAYAIKCLEISRKYSEEFFKVRLPESKLRFICEHSDKHPHGCRENLCPYYKSI